MSDGESDDENEIEETNNDPASSQSSFKMYLMRVLTENDLDQKRASKMEILDFLTLLNSLNKAGIHFR